MNPIKMNPVWKAPRIGASEIRLLERLSNANGVSGDEEAIRKIVLELVEPLADDLNIDSMGNVLVTKKGKGNNLPRVMVDAHMDEVGFMIGHGGKDGFMPFVIAGGISPSQIVGKQVTVGEKLIPGVMGINPIHLTSTSERTNPPVVRSLRIDVGAENGSKVKPGMRAAFATKFQRIGPSVRGKAMDDRLGVATLITLLKNPPQNIDLLAAFTVQEELGLRGAKIAAYTLNPDMAIALDCTPALEMPMQAEGENTLYRSKLDHGPSLYVADGATISDPRLVKHLREIASTYKIPYQIRQPGMGGTNAGAIHKEHGGIPSVSVSVPGRYLHTAASIVRINDWKNTIALIHASLSHIDKYTLKGNRR
ncbi:MAG: M42 family peptidase [Chloroflexota bacterium]